ncbi:MAG: PAS domain S-box protein [Leptolyngbyaceae cyanobacterium MO_188.B28]|nr:PAS domain S-box protein [Leptolyngbyaceae cyanobacterium MO_188.B28]
MSTEHKQAKIEAELRQERDFIEAVLNAVDTLVVVLNPQGRILNFNQACERVTGYSLDLVKDHCVWELLVPPEEQTAVKTVFEALRSGQSATKAKHHWVTQDGEYRLIDWSNTLLRNAQGEVEYVIGTGIDITDYSRAEATLRQQAEHERLLGALARSIRQSLNLQDILEATVIEVRKLLQVDRTLIFRFNPNWSGDVIVESIGAGNWSATLGLQIYDPCFESDFAEHYRQGRVAAIENVYTAGLDRCHLDLLAQFQARATLIVPIMQRERLWGLLVAHHCSEPRQWQPFEINLLTQLAAQLALAIQQSELYQQLQEELREREQIEWVLKIAKDDLELRVAERTAELLSVNQKLQLELSERKQIEEALRVSQARFAGILGIAGDAIISIDKSQRITLFNQAAEQIFGYTADEVLGRPLDLLLPEQFIQAHRRHVVDFSQSEGKSRKMGERREIFGRRKGGEQFPAEASISKLELGNEKIFTVILRDVTERKQAEVALESLIHQNELILNSMDEGLCGLDLQAQITFANLGAAKLLGYSVDDLIGQSVNIILSPASVDADPNLSDTSPIYASLTDGEVHQVKDALFWRQDTSNFPVEYASTPIREKGKIVGAVITFQDISDRQIVERMKDEFISVVSHELRTPLTSIHGSLRMLASGLLNDQPDKSQRLLKIAADSTDRLVRLINDILDVERIESGKVKMAKQSCWVAKIMTQAANTMQTMADKAGITLSVSTLSAQVWADPDRIIQTFTNLLSNAIKFSSPGGTVWLTSELVKQTSNGERGEYVLFSVRDQGRGIPAEKIDTIFERFQQVDSSDSRDHEGTGLGLAICRSIIQQHKGQIEVESELGKGSTFYFTLPLSQ